MAPSDRGAALTTGVSAMKAWFAALAALRDRRPSGASVRGGASRSRRQRSRQRDRASALTLDLAPDDPLVAYCLAGPGVVEIDRLQLDSPAVRAWQAARVRLALPLVSQGELIGMITLGERVGGEDYSADDLALLTTLASQVAPAVRVAQLAQEQQAQARARARLEHELDVARLIQQTLLPSSAPELPGWRLAAYYQPARAVGGDFYDFLSLPDGRLGLVIGDVTDKGTPAALLMATTRSILRAAALAGASPGDALERANDLLHHDIPPRMFVTCFYATLEPQTGLLRFANAGHTLPLWRHHGAVSVLRASGMPLGLMPGMRYEEQSVNVHADDTILLCSDGLVEAHNPSRAMFGRDRLAALMAQPLDDQALIDGALGALATFVGADWEQEDDVTLVTLRALATTADPSERRDAEREAASAYTTDAGVSAQPNSQSPGAGSQARQRVSTERVDGADDVTLTHWRSLGERTLSSDNGDERLAMTWVAATLAPLALPSATLERLKTAVAEATMNAMEHGNQHDPARLVYLEALSSPTAVAVRVSDEGAGLADDTPAPPSLAAKLSGAESPRGWGLFLIRQLVDEVRVEVVNGRHTVRLVIARGAASASSQGRPSASAQSQEARDAKHPG